MKKTATSSPGRPWTSQVPNGVATSVLLGHPGDDDACVQERISADLCAAIDVNDPQGNLRQLMAPDKMVETNSADVNCC